MVARKTTPTMTRWKIREGSHRNNHLEKSTTELKCTLRRVQEGLHHGQFHLKACASLCEANCLSVNLLPKVGSYRPLSFTVSLYRSNV